MIGGALAHRNGLACQQRLVGLQIQRVDKRSVGGNPIAFSEHDEITTGDVAPGDTPALAAADHQGPRAGQVAQRLEHTLGAGLLDHGDRSGPRSFIAVACRMDADEDR